MRPSLLLLAAALFLVFALGTEAAEKLCDSSKNCDLIIKQVSKDFKELFKKLKEQVADTKDYLRVVRAFRRSKQKAMRKRNFEKFKKALAARIALEQSAMRLLQMSQLKKK